MRKLLSMLVMWLFCVTITQAQSHAISGKVLDKNGNGVEGASVQIRGKNIGTTVDSHGNFTINASPGDVLIISAINFSNKQIKVGSGLSYSVNLEPGAGGALQEVVVTALGQNTNKAKLGYSTTTIKSDVLNRDAPVSLMDGLAGKVAGANISNIGGPGASTKVVLRGYGIFGGGDNQPLYVIDGVPLSDGLPGTNTTGVAVGGASNTDFGNGMTNINPNDVESITILKGTAASSLYGSTAKNGAIMITTKRGHAGGIKVDYSGSVNLSYVGKLPEYQSEFGQGWGGEWVPDENGSWGPKLDGKVRPWGAVVNGVQQSKPFSFVKNNLRHFYTTGSEVNNYVALSGGNDANRFFFSYGNVTSDGIIPDKTDYLVRNTLSLRTNSIYNNFTINTSFNYINRKQNAPNTGQASSAGGGVFQSLLAIPTDIDIRSLKNYKSLYNNVDNFFNAYNENPYYGLGENGDHQDMDRFFGNVDMNYKFNPNLSATFRVGGDYTNARTKRWNQPNNPTPGSWTGGANPESAVRNPDVGSVMQGSDYAGILNGDFFLKYNKGLTPDLNLEVIGGANYYQFSSRTENTSITNLVIPGFFNLANSSNPPIATDGSTLQRRIGVYGQATLSYKEQLFLSGNARNDWSSTLPINSNHFFYPGANLSWLASKTFDLAATPISFLKFRAGYGKTGSDAAPYLVYSTLVPGNVSLGFGSLTFPFNGVPGFRISNQLGNLNLTPVFTTELEGGAEVRFLKDMLGLDVSVYDKRTKGQILPVSVAPSTGYTSAVQNLGLVENKGVELSFDARPINGKDFTWNFTYTFTKNWNKVLNLTGGPANVIINSAYDAEIRAVPGQAVGEMYAPIPEKTSSGQVIVNPNTGLAIAAQNKGDYGSTQYSYMMGFVNTFTYKDWSLNFSLDYRKGGVMYSGTADLVNFSGNGIATTYNDRKPFIIPNSVVASVDGSGKTTYTPNTTRITVANTPSYYYPNPANLATSYYNRILDKSFLKMRDITLAYRLPQKWANSIKFSNLSVALYARNLLLWTPKSNVYIDPESSNLGNDLQSELGEFSTAPTSKQFGFSFKARF